MGVKIIHKYLSQNKVPPRVAVKGMQVPPKPVFLDLNELDHKLIRVFNPYEFLVRLSV